MSKVIRSGRLLANTIREARISLDWSQKDLADKAGIPEGMLKMMESSPEGAASASVSEVIKVLKVTGYDLLIREAPQPKNAEELQRQQEGQPARMP